MATVQLDKARLTDEEVVDWRIEQLLRAGFNRLEAVILAKRSHVDLHEAVELLERDCPPQIAVEILL